MQHIRFACFFFSISIPFCWCTKNNSIIASRSYIEIHPFIFFGAKSIWIKQPAFKASWMIRFHCLNLFIDSTHIHMIACGFWFLCVFVCTFFPFVVVVVVANASLIFAIKLKLFAFESRAKWQSERNGRGPTIWFMQSIQLIHHIYVKSIAAGSTSANINSVSIINGNWLIYCGCQSKEFSCTCAYVRILWFWRFVERERERKAVGLLVIRSFHDVYNVIM